MSGRRGKKRRAENLLQEEMIKLRGRRSKVSEETCREESKGRSKSRIKGCKGEEIKLDNKAFPPKREVECLLDKHLSTGG